MEIWVDPNDDGNWVNVNNFVDSGGWGKDGGECGGTSSSSFCEDV